MPAIDGTRTSLDLPAGPASETSPSPSSTGPLAHRAGDGQRRSASIRLALRLLPVLAVALAGCWAAAATPYRTAGPTIRSDGYGYYAWTKAIVTGDLRFCGDADLRAVRAISVRDAERGVCQNRYPPGMALVRLPVAGWFVDPAAGATTRPVEHDVSRWLSALTLTATAALVADAARRLAVGPLPTAVALLGGVFGTGLFHYSTYDGSFSHGTSALLVAGLCWLGVRAAGAGRAPPALPVVAVAGLATLTRNTNVVVLACLLVGWLVWQRVALGDRRALLRHVGPLVAGVAVGTVVQVAYNRYASGVWTLSSYGSATFVFDRQMQRSVLVSYERGLLTWYPVLGVVLASLLATAVGRRLAAWFAILVAPLVVLYGFWFSWELGGGFGHRGFVEIVPAVALLAAVGLTRLRRRALVVAVAGTAVATLVTVSLMAGYWRGTISFGGTTAATYWDHVVGDESLLTP